MQTPRLPHIQRIHFIGIGGAGMGGIAEVLLGQGYHVSGSDLQNNAMVQHLRQLGAQVFIGHHTDNISNAQIIVVSTAVSALNPEIVAAKAARLPIIPRAQMLADLMRNKRGIAVAGTHGKTTTTSLLACILNEAGLDPTFVIGGMLKSAGTNAYLGKSPLFVAEADESDASFLYLNPEISIVTNIDADHMSTYNNNFEQLCETFVQFLHRLPFNGLAVVCLDDPVIASLIPAIARPVITYGYHADADLRITNFQARGFKSHFTLSCNKNNLSISPQTIDVVLNLPGHHNTLNTAAACAVALSLGVSAPAISQALAHFTGVGRRLQIHGELPLPSGNALLVDDYGHHPREIKATWEAARQAWPDRRLVVLYQPHRYSRTRDLFADFVEALATQPDQLLLLDTYSAGEEFIVGADSASLFTAICATNSGKQPIFIADLENVVEVLRDTLQDGDILLTQGAGSVGVLALRLFNDGILYPEKQSA